MDTNLCQRCYKSEWRVQIGAGPKLCFACDRVAAGLGDVSDYSDFAEIRIPRATWDLFRKSVVDEKSDCTVLTGVGHGHNAVLEHARAIARLGEEIDR